MPQEVTNVGYSDRIMTVRPVGRKANDSATNTQGQAESYSQPSVPGNQGNGQAPPSSYPVAEGWLGSIPTSIDLPVSRDPYKFVYQNAPVSAAPGDSPIVKMPIPAFRLQDPYARPSEGVNATPADPRDPSPTKVSYGGHG
jgi:hypothetical protein